METSRKKRRPLEERLLAGLQEIEEWARGERDDLRVTVASVEPDESQPQAPSKPTNPRPATR